MLEYIHLREKMNRYFGQQTVSGEWHALLPRYALVSERVTGRRVLDIGCGSGVGSLLLHEMGATMVNGIDHRPAVLEIARRSIEKEDLRFQVMFWEELGFDDDAFDVVLCLDPTAPVTDPSLLLEVQRVLKPEGEYICAVERKRVGGLEQLLPCYGYPTSAERVDLYRQNERVPQLGEVQRFFSNIEAVIQRPRLSYTFCSTDNDDLDHPLDIETRFLDPLDDPGTVEIWFCSDADVEEIPQKAVQLPYTEVVERLAEISTTIHMHSVVDRENNAHVDELFDEIVDGSDMGMDSVGFEEPTTATDSNQVPHASDVSASNGGFLSEFGFNDEDDYAQEFETSAFSSSASSRRHNVLDFEERISTNARFEPVRRDSNATDELARELQDKKAELKHLKEMFDGLTSVVERQSEMIQSLLERTGSDPQLIAEPEDESEPPAKSTSPAEPETPEPPSDSEE